MVAITDFLIAKQTLHPFMDTLFNDLALLNPNDWNIYAGFSKYHPNRVPHMLEGFTDRARAETLGLKTSYFTAVVNEPVKVARLANDSFEFYFPQNPKKLTTASTFLLKRRADLVLDSVDELNACGFPYTKVATNLSPQERKKVYGGGLSNVLQPQSGVKEKIAFFDGGEKFLSALIEKATYDTSIEDPLYYAKWRSDTVKAPKRPVERVFSIDNLTNDYLRHNFFPIELEKDAVYLLLRLKTIGEILIVLYDRGGISNGIDLSHDTLIVPPAFSGVGDIFSLVAALIRNFGRKWAIFQNEAWFFYSLEGTNAPQAIFTKQTPTTIPDLKLNLLEQVVDPQFMFQSMRGLPMDKIDDEQKKWLYLDWLKELVRLCFSNPWVSFWNNSYQMMFYTPDRQYLFLDELTLQWRKTPKGPMRDRLEGFLKQARQDQGMLFVRRGSKYGPNRRVVGSDESFVYFYNNEKELLTRLPMFSFWKGVNISQISTQIYENTKGLIPIMKLASWGSVSVAAIGVIGPEVLIKGAQEYVTKRLSEEAIKNAFERQFNEVRDRLFLMFVNAILSLFYDSGSNTFYNRTVGFIKGFLQGYTYDSFVALYKRWDSFAALEPSSLRTLRMLGRLESALLNLDEKLSRLAKVVDQKTAELLADRFGSAFLKAMTGLIGIIDNLYFLEYEKVKVVLDALSELTSDPPPTKQKWDEIRHKHMLEMLQGYTKEIKSAKADIKDLYDEAKQGIDVLRKALLLGETTFLLEYASGGLLFKSIIYALAKIGKYSLRVVGTKTKYVGPGLVAATVAAAAIDGKFYNSLGEVIGDLAEILAKGLDFVLGHSFNPDKLEKLGQLVGQLWGGITLNKAVFGDRGSIFQRWKTADFHSTFVTKETIVRDLSVSSVLPIIKLILFNYVYLIEKVIEESKQDWEDLEEELRAALTVEDEFKDILEEDKTLTLGKIVLILSTVRNKIRPWLKKLSQIPGLTDQIEPLIAVLKKTSPAKIPTFDDLRNGKDVDEWGREVIMFVVFSHLETSLQTLMEAIKDMEDPVNPDSGSPVSISFLLRLMGFHLNDQEAIDILDRNFDKVFQSKP